MIIDFNEITREILLNFKGGEGELHTRNFIDDKCKIMMSSLAPGASSGYHKHEGNCEIVYIINGDGYFCYDGVNEPFTKGDVHYCPMGHSHSMHNNSEDDIIYLAIVPEHSCKDL